MNNVNLFAEPCEHLMEVNKVYGLNLVFEEGAVPSDKFVQSFIDWAKSLYTLGFIDDPYEIEFEDDDFGDGIAVSIKWAQEIEAVSFEVINLVASYLTSSFSESGCKEIKVYTTMGDYVVKH